MGFWFCLIVGFGTLALEDDSPLLTAESAFDEVVLSGFTRASARMRITTEVAGTCEMVAADVGEVMADGIFARLDDTFTALDLERNARARARLKNQIAYFEKELARRENLLARETISESLRDEMAQQRDQAMLQKEELAVEARILEERLRRFTLRAPKGWQVITRNLEPGQWVAAGTVVAEVGNYEMLHVPFAVDERTLARLRTMAEEVPIRFPDHDVAALARLMRISPAFDETTRKVAIELAVDGQTVAPRGGLRVALRVRLNGEPGVVVVPDAALERRYDAYWLTREDGSRVRVTVVGNEPGGRVRVSGERLAPGDRFQRAGDR